MGGKKKQPKKVSILPTRSSAHVTGEQAALKLRGSLPKRWIVRKVGSDYGIDCEIEIVDTDSSVTGAMLLAHVKGTDSIEESAPNIVQLKSSTVRYWMLLPLPVIIVRVTENPLAVLWLDVRQHLKETERNGMDISCNVL
jgi:hypothetical protein